MGRNDDAGRTATRPSETPRLPRRVPGHDADWHGLTPTDVIFPMFLFIVGVAIPFSRRGTARQALRRGAVLFAFGLFIAAYPTFDLSTLRIPGVLQRIAVCYVAAWLLHRLGTDPAFGSGPLATVIQDLVSLLIYFTVATVLVA